MYLLYMDESGNPDNPQDRHFVLGGAAVFERQTFFLAQDLDEVQRRHFPGLQPVVFHATDIRAGSGFWRTVPQTTRQAVLQDIGNVIAGANRPGLVLFGAAIEKTDALYGEVAVERATAEVCRRFDIFLMRRKNESNDPQRGLLVFAEGRFRQRTRVWVKGFRELGTQWGVLVNLSDIPYFASAAETRLLQLADFVSHAIYLLYERRDATLIGPTINRFDQKDDIIHGLVHISRTSSTCECPACASRRAPGSLGTWFQATAPQGP
ncbi:MAG: DUF3800 domain-containing protein [bacterium]|nr:DUF3800 domain-containing protein [bacterium]